MQFIMVPDKIIYVGRSGGTSCFYDLAERYRHRNLVAERECKDMALIGVWKRQGYIGIISG